MARGRVLAVRALAVFALGCGGTFVRGDGPVDWDDEAPVQVTLPDREREALHELHGELASLSTLSTTQLLARHPTAFSNTLGYDPRKATGLSLIQASEHRLSAEAIAKLAEQGFVIDRTQTFASMAEGYRSIYVHDLPVYVSLDSILDTVYLSYDAILAQVEQEFLSRDLTTLLTGIRDGLPSLSDRVVAADLDMLVAVALGLLTERPVAPVAGADADEIERLRNLSEEAVGIHSVNLFGLAREVDFSQMEPRGHYTRGLGSYFRAMMWLGRTDFRMIESVGGGRVLRPRQLAALMELDRLITGDAREAYTRIDAVLSAFVGQHDTMHLGQVPDLMDALDIGSDEVWKLAQLNTQDVAQIILERGYGAQRIASQVKYEDVETVPLDRSFALLGQRYVVDSEVLSNVVFDRVPKNGQGDPRLLPDPLDAAYAALGNATALPLLKPQLDRFAYAPHLEQMRAVVETHDTSFWEANLYNRWLTVLRTLSPGEGVDARLPTVARSQAWSRRILNTQLGSWSQLRHNTVLYAKQSYSSGLSCEFPDAYVDPYPEAFGALARYAEQGLELSKMFEFASETHFVQRLRSYFAELKSVSAILQEMAEHQRAGTPFNETQLAFINDAVVFHEAVTCGPAAHFSGWYGRLLFDSKPSSMNPAIADVHTSPGGDWPPNVLHVATGFPRLMVVTVDSCTGPRAYAGLAFAYHEVVTGLDRLNDGQWSEMAPSARDVPWMQPILP